MTQTEIQSMVVRMIGDATSYQRMCKEAQTATAAVGKTVDKAKGDCQAFGDVIDNLGSKMNAAAGQFRAMAALQSPIQMIQDSIKLAGQAETSKIEFGTMLMNDRAGEQMVRTIQKFAAETPLASSGIEKVARTLLQFQVAQEDIIPVMKQLGDAAGGSQDKFARLALAFGQMRGTGRVTNEELNQMREAGFYPLAEMAKIVGKDVGVMRDEIAKGNVPFRVLEQALKDATSEGGRFFNGMQRASRGLEGLTSTMNDDIDALRRTVGEFVISSFHLKEGVQAVSSAAKTAESTFNILHPVLKGTVVIIGVLVAALMFLAVTWKVGASMLGIVVANYAHMVNTFNWVTGAVARYSMALAINTTYTLQNATANATLAGTLRATTGAFQGASASAGLFRIGLVGVILYGVSKLIELLPVMQRHAQNAIDELARLDSVISHSTGHASTAANSAADTAAAAAPGVARAAAIEKATEDIKKRIADQQQLIDLWTTNRDEIRGSAKGVLAAISPWRTEGDEELDKLKKLIDGAVGQLELYEAALVKLNSLKRENDAGLDPATRKALGELNTQLEHQFATFGMTAEQAKIYDLKMRGVTETELATIRALIEGNAALKRRADLMKSVNDVTKSMEHALQTEGMNPDQVRLWELAMRGATDAELANARGLAAMRAELERVNKFMEEGKRVTEELRTPEEQYGQRISLLNKLLREGAITGGTYERGVQKAADDLNKIQMGAHQSTAAIKEMYKAAEAPQAVLRNSAEAFTRIAAFRDANQRNPDSTGPDWKSFNSTQQNKDQVARETLKTQRDIKKILERSSRQSQAVIVPSNLGSA